MKGFFQRAGHLLLAFLVLDALLLMGLGVLRWQGLLLLPHEAAPDQWEVFGVDVSAYQGAVDWKKMAEQGVDFAFIKATEGSALRDRQFAANWQGAAEAGVRAGAYHFLSYDSPGETQAVLITLNCWAKIERISSVMSAIMPSSSSLARRTSSR